MKHFLIALLKTILTIGIISLFVFLLAQFTYIMSSILIITIIIMIFLGFYYS